MEYTPFLFSPPGFDSQLAQEFLSVHQKSMLAPGFTQAPVNAGGAFPWSKSPGEYSSPPSSAEIKNEWSYTFMSYLKISCRMKDV
jgi:hypothetical protein